MIMTIILITFLSCIANIVGTVSGFGVGTVMTPVLLLFMPFTETILLVCILHWFHDIWKLLLFRRGINWRLFFYFGIPAIVAGFIGALLVTPEKSIILESLFGLFLLSVVVLLLNKPTFILPPTIKNNVIGGLFSGFLAGLFGIRGAVHVFFLTIFDLEKVQLIGTTGIISLLLDSVRWLTYWMRGIALPAFLYWSFFIFVPASFLGAIIGQRILDKIPQKHFRTIVLIFLLLISIRLLLSPWF